ncbi:MAG: hypothetical protein JOZ81_10210 [Chloroflexi bacterium]|nr:hypothetical protein [Chloroflexota bacterium]MBV9545309.1 hypothetical protein [Chloroflexota bacterium]
MVGMMLTRHTQVENLANLLGARRSAAAREAGVQHAYLNLVAAVLDVPVSRLGQPEIATMTNQPAVLPIRSARRQAA